MGGNVFEWNEAIAAPGLRGLRGGSWLGDADILRSSFPGFDVPASDFGNGIGFRVASIPAPDTGVDSEAELVLTREGDDIPSAGWKGFSSACRFRQTFRIGKTSPALTPTLLLRSPSPSAPVASARFTGSQRRFPDTHSRIRIPILPD